MQSSGANTSDEKMISEKSSAELEADVEALFKQRLEECPERKRLNDMARKWWAKEDEMMKKMHARPTPSVGPQLEASLKKASEQLAELKELHGHIGESLDRLYSADAV
ncbi:hypothetical protein MMC31_004128 [Peltigera leucophlebia]|nr:hypothetical protein [Peltigera leucophlebia]